MAKIKKIKMSNLPHRYPLVTLFCLFTCLHYWNAPGWIYGVFGVIYGIQFIVQLATIETYEAVDLFEGWEEKKPAEKPNFRERLDEMAKEKGYK
jgi:hypothetical protein